MLTPDELLHISEGAEDIAESLHRNILDRIIKRIMTRIGRGDSYILTAQDKWQLQVLQDAGYLMEDVQKEIAKATGLMQSEVAEAMEDAGVKALARDNSIYEAAGLSPTPLDQSPNLIRLVQRNYDATLGEWTNFTRTLAETAGQSYVTACDKAYNMVMSGTVSYSQAVKEALSEIVKDGVTVQYYDAAGLPTRKDTIETATLRAVRTGISQASAQITDARMEEMDWDIILVSSHMGARVTGKGDYTDHSMWQGKFYSKSGKDKRFPPYEVCGPGKVQGIHGANCRHTHGPGDGEHNPWEDYDSEENRKAYEQQQRQRTLESRIRNTKQQTMSLKTARDSAEDDATRAEFDAAYQRKAALLQKQNATYNQFCEENNLRKRSDRIAIAQWDRREAAQARAAAKKYAKDHPNSVAPKNYKPISKSLIEKAKTIQDVESAFRENDWFVHAEINGKEWRSDSEIKLSGCDLESAKATYEAYEKFYKKYPHMIGKLTAPTTSVLAPHVDANCTMGFGNEAVTLNVRSFGDFTKFSKRLVERERNGWHPKGCNTPMSLVMHELGHAMDGYLSYSKHVYGVTGKGKSGWLSNKIRPVVMKSSGLKIGDISREVSQYGTTNPQEWFAECFAEYMCSDNPRKVASEFGRLLDKIMEGM